MLDGDCETAVPICRVYTLCSLLAMYTDHACVERVGERKGELKPDCHQTMLTIISSLYVL